jgi:hypothetical protein
MSTAVGIERMEAMKLETASSPYSMEQTSQTANEKIASLFQPDTLVAEQYFADRRRKMVLEPEKRLMLAILADAISCFQDNHLARWGKKKMLFDQTQGWIFEVCADRIFGFESVCSALGFNPEYIRQGLARWRQKELSKHRSAPLWKRPTLHDGTLRQI